MARRRRTSTADDFIEIVSALPWWAGVLLALVSYVALRTWASALGAATTAQPAAILIRAFVYAGQFVLPLFCLIAAATSAWRSHQRRQLAIDISAGKTADVLDGMSWREFEMLVGEGFRLQGFSVVETGGAGADGGVDLVLRKGGEKYLVQCKQWRAYKVGVPIVRDLYGVMAAKGAAGGFVVTSGRFTDDARAFAEGRNITLMEGDALLRMIRSVRRDKVGETARNVRPKVEPASAGAKVDADRTSSAPNCPQCAGPMVQRVARKGSRPGESFWGCGAFPKCKGTA